MGTEKGIRLGETVNCIHLQSFIIVATCGSITLAASKLYMNPSSLLQQMNLFEKELGFKVFIRSHRGVALTEAGELLYREGRKVLQETESILSGCRTIATQQSTTAHVALFAPYSAKKLFDLFIQHERPDAGFVYDTLSTLDAEEIFPRILSGELDIVEHGRIRQGKYDDIRFFEYDVSPLCCACKITHPLANQDFVSIKDLQEYKVCVTKNVIDIQTSLGYRAKESDASLVTNEVIYSPEAVMECCDNNGIWILAAKQRVLFDHLCVLPIVPEIQYCHCLAYAVNCKPLVRDFFDFAHRELRGGFA